MKKYIVFFATILLTGFSVHATTLLTEKTRTSINNGGYGNSFIFVEGDIEFSVFPDGQFDFNRLRDGSRLNVSIGSPQVNISFNSGYDYNAYVQYDEYGAIIQIENIPIYYDYYGRISRAGTVNIFYNNYGYVSRVGELHVYYNNYNHFSHCSGFINVYNRQYVYRPWHTYYSVPSYNHRVVYNRPYRQHYQPVRYVYSRPYYNNHRPITSVASRRGQTISRNRSYATVTRNNTSDYRRNTKSKTDNSSARYSAQTSRSQKITNLNTNRKNNTYESTRTQGNAKAKPETSTRRIAQPLNTNRQQQNVTKNIRPITSNSGSYQSNRQRNNSVTQKPKSDNKRTYIKSNSNFRNVPQVASRSVQSKSSSNNNIRSSTNRRR